MSLVQHICKFFCFGCYVQNFFFHFLAIILSYHLNLSLFEAFQFHARTSHPLKKVRLEKSGTQPLYLGWLLVKAARQPCEVDRAVSGIGNESI